MGDGTQSSCDKKTTTRVQLVRTEAQSFRRDVVRFEQLTVGLLLSGVVRNVPRVSTVENSRATWTTCRALARP